MLLSSRVLVHRPRAASPISGMRWPYCGRSPIPHNSVPAKHSGLTRRCVGDVSHGVLGSTTRVGFGLVPSLSLAASIQLAVGHAGYMVSSSFRDGIVKSSPITPCRELEILSNDKSSSSSARTNAYLRRASNL